MGKGIHDQNFFVLFVPLVVNAFLVVCTSARAQRSLDTFLTLHLSRVV
jgi:hypothetical protein